MPQFVLRARTRAITRSTSAAVATWTVEKSIDAPGIGERWMRSSTLGWEWARRSTVSLATISQADSPT